MELIKHNNPKYGFFVGYKPDPRGIERVPQPVWQPDKDRARISFNEYLKIHGSTTVERELSILEKDKRFTNKLSIIQTW